MRERTHWIRQTLKELNVLLPATQWEYVPKEGHPNEGDFVGRWPPSKRQWGKKKEGPVHARIWRGKKSNGKGIWRCHLFSASRTRYGVGSDDHEPWRALQKALEHKQTHRMPGDVRR